mmetsp:Transcript_6911/g.20170  ORF Transcript_6911/g.20170 Transcript_6911/m.20170 type:complete len:258 (-) Transcript_6911:887-1660(-)
MKSIFISAGRPAQFLSSGGRAHWQSGFLQSRQAKQAPQVAVSQGCGCAQKLFMAMFKMICMGSFGMSAPVLFRSESARTPKTSLLLRYQRTKPSAPGSHSTRKSAWPLNSSSPSTCRPEMLSAQYLCLSRAVPLREPYHSLLSSDPAPNSSPSYQSCVAFGSAPLCGRFAAMPGATVSVAVIFGGLSGVQLASASKISISGAPRPVFRFRPSPRFLVGDVEGFKDGDNACCGLRAELGSSWQAEMSCSCSLMASQVS